jgi:AraC-like DNA-binding protein
MSKIVFALDALPPELTDMQRMEIWQDLYMRTIYPFEVSYLADWPPSVRFEFAKAGEMGIAKYRGTMGRIVTSPKAVAQASEIFALSYVEGASLNLSSRRGDFEFRPGSFAVLKAEPGDNVRYSNVNGFSGIAIPAERMLQLVPGAEDMARTELSPSNEALRHLFRYIQFLLDGNGAIEDANLAAHVETTLSDLIVLTLDGAGDRQEVARLRGLRAARLQEILLEIKNHFAQPDFTAEGVAARLGLSASYIQKILHESGRTFTERVIELRLRKAAAMLADARYNRLKVSDIALACGFNEISHFNHCFRRRFGATPTQYRGGGNGKST